MKMTPEILIAGTGLVVVGIIIFQKSAAPATTPTPSASDVGSSVANYGSAAISGSIGAVGGGVTSGVGSFFYNLSLPFWNWYYGAPIDAGVSPAYQ